MNPLHPFVAARAGFRCEYCHAPELIHNFTFEVEHIYPRSAGGSSASDNLALSCTSCNVFKSDAVDGWDADGLDQAPFFHPRHDFWEHHFVFDAETFHIRGLTPIGRVTVTRLKMNSPLQVRACSQWMQLGYILSSSPVTPMD